MLMMTSPLILKKKKSKSHNHNHTNPYKERFMKEQKEEKGYTPVRQYSLFDDKED